MKINKTMSHEQLQRKSQFIAWCKENISAWPVDCFFLVNFRGQKFTNFTARKRMKGLCMDWTACSKKEWKK